MESYLIGVIEVNPKEILTDGIRRELIKLICLYFDRTLIFKTKTIQEFEANLYRLSSNMEGFKQALAYIQDFINIYGLKIWHEEFNRLINAYIDMEAGAFVGMEVCSPSPLPPDMLLEISGRHR